MEEQDIEMHPAGALIRFFCVSMIGGVRAPGSSVGEAALPRCDIAGFAV